MLAVGCASLLAGCGPHVYKVAPGHAATGELQHEMHGPEKLSITYEGKAYFGEFEATRSRRIHGRHQRHRGFVGDVELSARDSSKLYCHLEWAHAGEPSGSCREPSGKAFAIRFE
jgi:hypothetical protein